MTRPVTLGDLLQALTPPYINQLFEEPTMLTKINAYLAHKGQTELTQQQYANLVRVIKSSLPVEARNILQLMSSIVVTPLLDLPQGVCTNDFRNFLLDQGLNRGHKRQLSQAHAEGVIEVMVANMDVL